MAEVAQHGDFERALVGCTQTLHYYRMGRGRTPPGSINNSDES